MVTVVSDEKKMTLTLANNQYLCHECMDYLQRYEQKPEILQGFADFQKMHLLTCLK